MTNLLAYHVGWRHGAANKERDYSAVKSCDIGSYEDGWRDGLNEWRAHQPAPEPLCGPRPMPNYHRAYYEGWRKRDDVKRTT